ncbi:protein of unknown function (plasmid) [Caballeronia sp. S22]
MCRGSASVEECETAGARAFARQIKGAAPAQFAEQPTFSAIRTSLRPGQALVRSGEPCAHRGPLR